ncbi:MAG: efflux RND transporter permease subunit [Clostridia bacterium]|nr:efflux RND transporter permease subunit [Clostridia bacterium]
MNISGFSVKRPVTTLMFMLIVILLGVVSFTMIPLDLYPSMEVPVALVIVQYPNTAPEEIETLITKPIEQQLATVENLKALTSISSEGSSLVVAEFEYGTDMNFASLEMREKVAILSDYLPDNSSDPMVFKINPQMLPIMEIQFSSEMPLSELHTLIDKEIDSKLERISGVASADIFGGLEEEIAITIDQEKLTGYQLSLSQISSTLSSENINLPSGNVDKGSKEMLVRTIGEFQSIDEIKNIPIMIPTGELIVLSDIAYIEEGFKEQDALSRVNGVPSIGVILTKQSTANTVTTADRVLSTLDDIQQEYPDLEVSIGYNQADFINRAVSNVSRTAMIGGLLAIVVLFLFLYSMRSTLIIAIAIPVSVIATFALMYFNDITLNIISLGGLALGVGMLVDNSIVVLENIYRLQEDGVPSLDAAINGSKEVTAAIFASTMTTVAVFLPVVFVKGFTAILFKELSFTVTFSLLASFGVAITVVPMLCSKFLSVRQTPEIINEEAKKSKFSRIKSKLNFMEKFIHMISSKYVFLLEKSLVRRKRTIAIAVVLFVVSLGLLGVIGGELFPQADEGSLTIDITTPYGTSLADTDEIIMDIESYIATIDEVKTYTVSIGASSFFSMGANENTSTIRVELVKQEERKRTTSDIATEIRNELSTLSGAEYALTESSQSSGGGGAAPIEIKIQGDDLTTLREISEDIITMVASVEGTTEIDTDVEEGNPEIRVFLDRQKSSYFGITAYQLAKTLESSLTGTAATTYKVDGDEIDISISLSSTAQESIEGMKQILVQSPTGQYVPVGQIAKFEYGNSPSQIQRENQVRTITISSKLYGRDLGSVSREISEKLSEYTMPFGYSYEMGGQQKDMQEAFADLSLALLLSILLVYMILASQFESLLQPFIIMMSVPFALTGAFLGLFFTGKPLSLPAFIGLIVLAGIVVNNAIVLIDFINQQRKSGVERKSAIINAGKTRLRPILMTTLTTVLGLTPLALGIGEGSEIQAPMGVSVIGGLSFSTLVTLILIPVLYSLLDDVKRKISRKKHTTA